MTKILVTGSEGFIGSHLILALKKIKDLEILEASRSTSYERLQSYCSRCAIVIHLAGVNRPSDDSDFMPGNAGITRTLVAALESAENFAPIIMASSIQASSPNPYGLSKMAAEEIVSNYSRAHSVPSKIYRLKNVFGARCKPNYNSVVATFCYNITRKIPITISDRNRVIDMLWVGDVVAEFVKYSEGSKGLFEYRDVDPSYTMTLGDLVERLNGFALIREGGPLPDMSDQLNVLLHSTFVSYYPVQDLSYDVEKRSDPRGWLFELIRSKNAGQIFISSTNPGFERGNHYHTKKIEKFCVVKGRAEISFRDIHGTEIETYRVDGENIKIIDIPTAYTHKISNVGDSELITIFWANEPFNQQHPDTYFDTVSK